MVFVVKFNSIVYYEAFQSDRLNVFFEYVSLVATNFFHFWWTNYKLSSIFTLMYSLRHISDISSLTFYVSIVLPSLLAK